MNNPSLSSYLETGKNLLTQENYQVAIETYQEALKLYPDNATIYRNLGFAQEKIGDTDGEIISYQKAIKSDPQQPRWVYITLGVLLQEKERLEDILNIYNIAKEIFPDPEFFLAEIESIQEILTTTKTPEIYLEIGQKLFREEKYDEAIALYQEGIEKYPSEADNYRELGVIQEKIGDFEGQLESYQKAVKLDRNQPVWVYTVLAKLLTNNERFDEAIAIYQQGIALYPDRDALYRELGVVQEKIGDISGEIASYQKAIKLNPSQPVWVYTTLANLLENQEQGDEAHLKANPAGIALYETAIKGYQEQSWPYLKLAELQQQLSNHEKALELYEKAIEIEPKNSLTYVSLIKLLKQENRLEEALKKCELALELAPHNDELQGLKKLIEGDDSPVRLLAFFLPQYHPIPENDEWWGKGFTEWTNVTKAKPLFKDHYQPHLPADLGFYDLRLPEVREAQAELARQYGIYGFCYYYYWFAGKRLLDRPLEEMLESKKPDFPFCLCWANENWSRRWDGSENEILIAQDHSEENDRAFAESVIPYLLDERYIRINGKPLLIIYRANILPEVTKTIQHWREVFRQKGIGKVYLCAVVGFGWQNAISSGFDAELEFPPNTNVEKHEIPDTELKIENFGGKIYDYQSLALNHIKQPLLEKTRFFSAMLSWDNTARKGQNAHIYHNFSLSTYELWLQSNIQKTKISYSGDERLVFINAWNEWAEGTHLEPDQKNGHSYLESTKKSLESQDKWEIYVNLIQSYQGNDYGKLEKILVGLYNSLLKQQSNPELILETLQKSRLNFKTIKKTNHNSLEWTLENPTRGETLSSNFAFNGWIVSKKLQPITLEIIYDGLIIQQIPVDGFRKDVKDYFSEYKSHNNYFSGFLKIDQLELSRLSTISLNINVIYQNGQSEQIGLVDLKQANQNLSTLKRLPNLSNNCLNLIKEIESYLQKNKPILFILHDIAAAGAQLFLVRQLEWIAQNYSEIRFKVLVNIPRQNIPNYGQGGKLILERLEKISPVYFLEPKTNQPENINNIQKNHYSLIYVNTSVLGDLLESIGKIDSQIIVHIHELEFWIKYRLGKDKFNKYLKYNPKFIACSNAVKNNLVNNLNINQEQIEVIHAYVPVEKLIKNKTKTRSEIRQELNLSEDTFVIASCGTLDWRKGADLLVPLTVLLKEKLPHKKFVYLWIGGFMDKLSTDEIKFTIEKAGLEQDIMLLGHKNNPINYLNASDVFVLLSKEDPFPLVMSEAAVCKLPIVGFDGSGGVTELVESDAGLLAPYLNLSVMAEKIAIFYENPKMRQEMGENAFRKINELYNETVLAPKIVQLIQSLIEKSSETQGSV